MLPPPLLLLLLLSALLCPPSVSAINAGLTADFRQWLASNGFSATEMARDDLNGGSFGGRTSSGQQVTRQPIVFVHGNSDRALGDSLGGWSAQAAYFERRGYQSSELYATTWGPASSIQASSQSHTYSYVSHIRKFIQAVLLYTGADKIDIVAHSMGVTLSRKAIKGGALDGFSLGAALTSRIDTFVAIAGANYGLTTCYSAPLITTCNNKNGFFPGTYNPLLMKVTGRSKYLEELLDESGYEGAYRYSVWTPDDELIMFGCVVYGKVTCNFPGMTGEKRLPGLTHKSVRDETANIVHSMVTDHVIL